MTARTEVQAAPSKTTDGSASRPHLVIGADRSASGPYLETSPSTSFFGIISPVWRLMPLMA